MAVLQQPPYGAWVNGHFQKGGGDYGRKETVMRLL